MATKTWNAGSGTGNMSDPGNWNPSGVPTPADTAINNFATGHVPSSGVCEAGTVTNNGTISGGTWLGAITNNAKIYGGTFLGAIVVGSPPNAEIGSGTFYATVDNSSGGDITGGDFYGTVTGNLGSGTLHQAGNLPNPGDVRLGIEYGNNLTGTYSPGDAVDL